MKDWNNSFGEVFIEKGLQNSEFFLIIGNGIALNGCQGINQWDVDPVQAYRQYSALLLYERKNELLQGGFFLFLYATKTL